MDEAGFSSYVAARRTQLFRTACLLSGDPHRAEDIVQDALARLYGVAGPILRRSHRAFCEDHSVGSVGRWAEPNVAQTSS